MRRFLENAGLKMMEYKGYIGVVEFDDKAKIFHGDVINTRDVITFQGKTVDDIENAFHDSIDDYISWCEQDGVNPENLIPESSIFVCHRIFIRK